MIIVKPEGATPCCRSEKEFMRAVHDQPGVYLANANVPNSSAPGAFTREVDGVMLSPHGIYTVEVKGIRARGELHTPRMDSWSINDGDTKVDLKGRPHAQALAHSKYLASFLKDTGIAPGWIRAVLAIVGEDIVLPEGAEVLVTDNVYVVLARPGVGEVLRQQVPGSISQREVSVEMVQAILTAFECVASAPTREALIAEGFRTETDIAAEVEAQRQQVRAEFLAATATTDPTPEATSLDGQGPVVAVADAPSSPEWRVTAERYAAARALDAELTETGAFVDGVPMHRRLISYTDRKGITLAEVAAVVNAPVEVLGDDSDANLIYCGTDFAVSVRALDGMAMFYKPVRIARAEREGATVNGREITARAAKQANAFGLSLEAVVRVVSEPEERWWVPGTTDVAHARGEFVAVTSGHLGPVAQVQTRASAVHRAAPKPPSVTPEPVETKVTDVVLDGVTIRASAVGWCQRRHVDLATIVAAALSPVQSWPGHSPNMEVRSGPQNAVLLDVQESAVVAVMTTAEAVEYRDGVTKDGVRLSGRCVFLSKRRKVSVDEIISAAQHPLTIARAPGSSQSVYIGSDLAVTVEDQGRAVVDFTYASHARDMIRRKELVPVDLYEQEFLAPAAVAPVSPMAASAGSAAPVVTPSPAMFAKPGTATPKSPTPKSAQPVAPAPVVPSPRPVSPLVMARPRTA